jgi:hypothetical protein
MNLYDHLYATGSVQYVSKNYNRYILKLMLIILGRAKSASYFYANVFKDLLDLYQHDVPNVKNRKHDQLLSYGCIL